METRVRRFGASLGIGRLVTAGALTVAWLFSGQPTSAPVHAADATNLVGMNTSGFSDWGLNKALVDVIKLARPWETMSGSKPRTDANGWPLEDARTIVWADLPEMNGTYRLSFDGQAAVSVDVTGWDVANQTYDALTNTSRADVVIDSRDKSTLQLAFQNTSGGVKHGLSVGIH
jgi:hypothetical protein